MGLNQDVWVAGERRGKMRRRVPGPDPGFEDASRGGGGEKPCCLVEVGVGFGVGVEVGGEVELSLS